MDMYQKRKMRQEKSVNEVEENSKMNINWYPGHMAKTRKQIEEDLKLIDVVIEILDSRIPASSQNPDIQELTKNKKKIILLNKSDLADSKQNNLWVEFFKQKGIPVILTNCNLGNGVSETLRAVENIMKDQMEEYAQKGRVGRKIRVMVLGIPNVGKSSFINRVAKNNNLEVGNKPGVTKHKQWIRVNDKIELLDTPGVLWPKFENEEVAHNLSFTGTIKDDILPITEIAYQLLKLLLEKYKENISIRYKISKEHIEEILLKDEPENFNIYEVLLEIGKKRGCMMSGGQVDDERTSKLILDEFRSGKLGKISIESPSSL